jgi:hypothetical protein
LRRRSGGGLHAARHRVHALASRRAREDGGTPDSYALRLLSVCFTKKLNGAPPDPRHLRRGDGRRRGRAARRRALQAPRGGDIEARIQARCGAVFQVEHVTIAKVKVLRAPWFTEDGLARLHMAPAAARPAEVDASIQIEYFYRETVALLKSRGNRSLVARSVPSGVSK